MPTKGSHPITVAFDGSADAERALQWGVDLARKQRAPLTVRIPTDDEYDDFLTGQWAAEAEALLAFCGLDEWSVDLGPSRFDDGSVLVLPTGGLASDFVASACPYLSGADPSTYSWADPASARRFPVVTVRRALEESSTRVVVGICEVERARGAIGFGYDHAEWIGGSVLLVDLTGPVRHDVRAIIDELAQRYQNLPVTVSAAEGVVHLIELSRAAILVAVATDAAPGSIEMLRTEAACSVAVVG